MANTLVNLARVQSTTVGTGTLTLGSAIAGFNTFADAGLTNGQTVTYAIEDYSADNPATVVGREIGVGTYSSAGPTIARTTVYSSTSGGAKINCTGRQHVFITAAAEDLASLATDLTAHLNDTSDAHDASAISFSATGGIASTDVQAAIAELDSEKLSTSAAASAYQPLDSDLTALAANISAFGHDLVDSANASAARTTLGLGTMATETASNYLTTSAAASGYQPLDSELTAIAGLTSAADRLPYFTGAGTASLATFTAAGRNLLDDADASAQRTTLGLGTAAVKNTGTSGNTVPLLDGTNTFSAAQTITTSSSFATNLYLINTSADNLAAPIFEFYRNSASPAASDVMGMIKFLGNNDVGTQRQFAQVKAVLGDPTNGSEDSSLAIVNYQAGAFTQVALFGLGGYIGSPTGFEKGTGTLNAVTLYENGASLAAKYSAIASANTFTAAQTVSVDSAATNTVTTVATLRSTSTGTPAAGIGVALDFAAETAAGNNEIGARIGAVTTDVTSTSEDFDLVISTMAAGAAVAEVGRHKSTGTYKMPVFTVANLPAGTAGEISFASNGRKNGEGAAAGTGVLVFHDGTAWRACDTGATVAA